MHLPPSRITRRLATRLALVAAAALGLPAYAQGPAPAAVAPRVKLTTTAGDIVVEVYPDKAPKTVENFLQYVRDKHYDGTIFHRVIDNFMIQGGGFDTRYAQKPTRAPIPHEGREALAKGGPRNVTGTIAMARTMDPNSASAQFFINVKDNAFLDHTAPTMQGYGYTVFGKVVAGMDVVNRIKSQPTGPGGPFPSDVPRTPVVIQSASILP
jgi:cyclophilin family peptidyl-prolyl cis-trans isomerase